MGALVQLNVSEGGMPKLPVGAAKVTSYGIEVDCQNNRKYHGGPNRAVCIYSVELYDRLREEGIDLENGSFGENFTTRGIDLDGVQKGNRLRARRCLIELPDVRIPWNRLKKWSDKLPRLIVGRSGWVAKVVEEAVVQPGDAIEVVS